MFLVVSPHPVEKNVSQLGSFPQVGRRKIGESTSLDIHNRRMNSHWLKT